MTKILLAVNNMNINGIKTSLLNMVNSLEPEKYEITILLLETRGPLLSEIPEYVNVIALGGFQKIKEMAYLPSTEAVKFLFKERRFQEMFIYLFLNILSTITGDKGLLYSYLSNQVSIIPTEYDYAVSYFGPLDILSFLILKKISAKIKCQWVHFDVRGMNFNVPFAKKYYPQFDEIYTVSNKAKVILSKYLPNIKVKHFQFSVPKGYIRKLAETNTINYRQDRFQIVTIGRLAFQKGPDIALSVANKLKQIGVCFEWHFIGGGAMYEKLMDEICAMRIQDCFILEGEQINPYRYLPNADLYVQPSRYEGYGLTIQEARVVGLPVVCTNFVGADEQIKNGIDGLIVDISADSLFNGVYYLISNKQEREKFRQAVLQENLSQDIRQVSDNKFCNLYKENINVQN